MLVPRVMLAVDVTVLDETVGVGLVNETEMKEGADQVRGTGPLKPLEPVRLRVDVPMLPGARFSDVGFVDRLKSGGALLSQMCNSGPKLP